MQHPQHRATPGSLAGTRGKPSPKPSPRPSSPVLSDWTASPAYSVRSAAPTVASESDYALPPPFVASSPESRQRRLAASRWRVNKVAGAFVAGNALGVAAVCAVLGARTRQARELPPPSTYPVVPPPADVPEAYLASRPLNNSCLLRDLTFPAGPQSFDACGFVVKSTDEVWNLRGDVEGAINKYFHEGYLDAGSWGRRIIGKQALKDAVLFEMRAFPDIRIHITDCVCKGNDIDGYKCVMPDILTGTNIGPSAYGPPTGRFARWTGMVESLVKRDPRTGQWQYYAEWGVHDEWSLLQQLGMDFARVPRPMVNSEPLHDCRPLLRFGPEAAMDEADTSARAAAGGQPWP